MTKKKQSTSKKRGQGFARSATSTEQRGQAPFPTTTEIDRRRLPKSNRSTKAQGQGTTRSATAAKPQVQVRAVPPPSDQLIGYLAEYDLRVGEMALALREMVLKEAPAASEIVFKSYVVSTNYSFTGKWMDGFCYIAVYPRHVNLGFVRGAELEDPEGLLIGSGKIMRHLKVAQADDLKRPYIRSFIRAAIRHSKAELAERASPLRARSMGKAAAKKRTRR